MKLLAPLYSINYKLHVIKKREKIIFTKSRSSTVQKDS